MKQLPSLSFVVVLASSASALSCGGGRTTALAATPKTPAAVGTVETKRTDNQNTEVDVSVEHLAPPGRVASGATTYVVWAQPGEPEARPQNIGSMAIDRDREGELKTKTPYKDFTLFITPEANPGATEPSNEPVLKAKVGR